MWLYAKAGLTPGYGHTVRWRPGLCGRRTDQHEAEQKTNPPPSNILIIVSVRFMALLLSTHFGQWQIIRSSPNRGSGILIL